MTHVLKTDLSSLERRLNKKLVLGSITSLSLPGAGISWIEDCSQLVGLSSVDVSNNPLSTREALALLFRAPSLSSLDVRGCPVSSSENFRRWVIAHNANLKILDGKEVTALERRYAYNLFPELKSGEVKTAVSKSVGDDLFGSGSLPVPIVKPAGVGGPAPEIFSVQLPSSTLSLGGSAVPDGVFGGAVSGSRDNGGGQIASGRSVEKEGSGFFVVTPAAHTSATAAAPSVSAAAKKSGSVSSTPPADLFGDMNKKALLHSDILSQHAGSSIHDNILDSIVFAPKPTPAPAVVAAAPVVSSVAGKDAILDNDVVAGKSFLDQKTKPHGGASSGSPAANSGGGGGGGGGVKKSASVISSAAPADIAGMFFEGATTGVSSAPVSKKSASATEVKIFEDKPVARPVIAEEVEFVGPKVVVPLPVAADLTVKSKEVETYQVGEELGESVSYDVEIICAYVMRGFRPGQNVESMNGLFEFSVDNNQMSPDTFYVRVTSHSGVSVHAGHVPAPERWSIDCRISLTDATMQDMLNGKVDVSHLLSGNISIDGSIEKLLLFRDVFRFALSRWEVFRKGWNECVRQEEKDLAELARGRGLETDFHDALEFLLFAWRGEVPPSWRGTTALMVISQLPDNLYYKGFRAQQHYTPPKVLLKMSDDCVEILPFTQQSGFLGDVACEVYGKKSIIRSLLNGTMSLKQVLSLLSQNSQQYRYGGFELGNTENPPFLCVRNLKENAFELMLKCFDITCLSYDRFCSEKRSKQQVQKQEQEERRLQREQFDKHQQQQQQQKIGLHQSATSPPVKGSVSSLDEWVEKLKVVKEDVRKRMNAAAASASVAGGSSPKKSGASDTDYGVFSSAAGAREMKTVMVPKARSEVHAERGFVILPKQSGYEI